MPNYPVGKELILQNLNILVFLPLKVGSSLRGTITKDVLYLVSIVLILSGGTGYFGFFFVLPPKAKMSMIWLKVFP